METLKLFNMNLPEYTYRRDGARTHMCSLAVWQRKSTDSKYLILEAFHGDMKAIYSQLPPARQYHPVGNSTHAVPNFLFGPFTDLNRIFMLFETVIRRVRHLSHLQSEPDTRKG